MLAITARVISTSFALVCFAGTLFLGLLNGNDAVMTLVYAILIGILAWLIGGVLSAVLMRVVNEHIRKHMQDNPVPDENDETLGDADGPQAAAG